jgi:hypothetical protein
MEGSHDREVGPAPGVVEANYCGDGRPLAPSVVPQQHGHPKIKVAVVLAEQQLVGPPVDHTEDAEPCSGFNPARPETLQRTLVR